MNAELGDARVFVTGAAGFGGSGLVKALLARGHAVTGLDIVAPLHADSLRAEMSHPAFRLRMEEHPRHPSGGRFRTFHSRSHGCPGRCSPRVRLAPIHLHAERRWDDIGPGGGAPCGLRFEAVICWFRQRSGAAPVSSNRRGPPPDAAQSYAFSKAAAEMAVWAWQRAYGIPATVMSNGTVVGPNMRREIFIFKWLWNALHGEPIVVEGGKQTRDITYVDDVVQAWLLAITAPAEVVVGRKFQVSYGEEHTVVELAGMCLEIARADVPIRYAGYRPGEKGQREDFSIERARRELGYAPKVPPREAIALTAQWVRSLV